MFTTPILIVPGLHGSAPSHWQSAWEAADSSCWRVVQRDWDRPDLDEWLATLRRCIASCASPPVLVAHSLACALVAHWVARFGQGASAALLVCPSDVDSVARTPPVVRGFSPMPLVSFPFRSIVVASTNDPRVDLQRAEFFAASWGSRFVIVKDAGHMNEQSGIGDWAAGKELLLELGHTLTAQSRPTGRQRCGR